MRNKTLMKAVFGLTALATMLPVLGEDTNTNSRSKDTTTAQQPPKPKAPSNASKKSNEPQKNNQAASTADAATRMLNNFTGNQASTTSTPSTGDKTPPVTQSRAAQATSAASSAWGAITGKSNTAAGTQATSNPSRAAQAAPNGGTNRGSVWETISNAAASNPKPVAGTAAATTSQSRAAQAAWSAATGKSAPAQSTTTGTTASTTSTGSGTSSAMSKAGQALSAASSAKTVWQTVNPATQSTQAPTGGDAAGNLAGGVLRSGDINLAPSGCQHNGDKAVCIFETVNRGGEGVELKGAQGRGSWYGTLLREVQFIDDGNGMHKPDSAYFLDGQMNRQDRVYLQPGSSSLYVMEFPAVYAQTTQGSFLFNGDTVAVGFVGPDGNYLNGAAPQPVAQAAVEQQPAAAQPTAVDRINQAQQIMGLFQKPQR